MLERARAHRDSHTYVAHNYEEFKDIIANKPGFVKAMWCGDRACEDKIKEETWRDLPLHPFAAGTSGGYLRLLRQAAQKWSTGEGLLIRLPLQSAGYHPQDTENPGRIWRDGIFVFMRQGSFSAGYLPSAAVPACSDTACDHIRAAGAESLSSHARITMTSSFPVVDGPSIHGRRGLAKLRLVHIILSRAGWIGNLRDPERDSAVDVIRYVRTCFDQKDIRPHYRVQYAA